MIGTVEFVGYCGRASAYNKTDRIMPYVVQSVFILLAPALFAASIYMTLGRIIRSIDGDRHSIIPLRWLTRFFVLGDVLSFLIQGGAAGLIVVQSATKAGQYTIVAGLFIQVISFGLFGFTALRFQYKLHRFEPTKLFRTKKNWLKYLYMLYTVSTLLMIRFIFRIVEYLTGVNGYLLGHEWTLYIFDTLPMLSVMVIFYIWHPSDLRKSSFSEEGDIVEQLRTRVGSK